MFTNVLVGVDGKQGGRDAIALASRLAEPSAKLTLLHVHSGRLRPTHAISPGLIGEELERSRTLLEQERAAARVDAELLSIEALSPGRVLHEQADDRHADLLVVGSCSRGAFGRAMLGDDTRASLNGAPCAVAIAAVGYADRPIPLANVGVAYNGSRESKAALAAARQLAEPTHATVHAMEVVALSPYVYGAMTPFMASEGIDTLLHEADERLRQLEGVEPHAAFGLTGEELASFGDELDLLVVGSRGYGPIRRLVLGTTSDYLERHARCSLLVVPRPVSQAPDAKEETEEHADTPIATGA